MPPSSPPAVVLGLGVHGLAIARSLGRHGVAVDAFEVDVTRPERHSRYLRSVYPTPSLEDGRLIDALLAYGRRCRTRAVLFVTMDLTVPVVSAHREVLRACFDFTLAPAPTLAKLTDKTRLPGFLARVGTPHPATRALRDAGDVEAVAATVGFPCVVKPATRSHRFKAAIVHDAGALRTLVERVRCDADVLVAQEWVPGEDRDVYFCFAYFGADGGPRAMFVGRKLLQYPRDTGIAALAEPCDDAVVLRESLRLFERAGYCGFGSTEFRRRPDTGEYVFIEFTAGRTDYNVGCAVANGVDLPYIGYRDILGLDPVSVPPVRRRRLWVDFGRAVRAMTATGPPRRRVRDAGLLRALSPRNAFTLFDPRDPAPMLAHLATRAGAPLRALGRRLGTARADRAPGKGVPWRT